jgi:hypothetical protein
MEKGKSNLPGAVLLGGETLLVLTAVFDFTESGTATSFPSKDGAVEGTEGFFVIAFGSNFPVYGAGAGSFEAGAGD